MKTTKSVLDLRWAPGKPELLKNVRLGAFQADFRITSTETCSYRKPHPAENGWLQAVCWQPYDVRRGRVA